MNDNVRRVLLSISAIVLCLAVVGCDDSDDGDDGGVQFFFGTNNIKECMPITVDVDLAAAGAVVAESNGVPDCTIDGTLAASGCTAQFTLVNGGNTLEAFIDGCETPLETNLFGCEFTQGDGSVLTSNSTAACDCVGEPICDLNIYCDPSPAICVSEDADPQSCEDCSNNVDDDGDGDVDCSDQKCHIVDCGWGQTTITCSTTSTTTTLFVTTTTTP